MTTRPDVLVVPTASLFRATSYFCGVVQAGGLPRVQARFTARDPAETNPHLKQLIPYVVVLDSGGQVLTYRRAGSGEARLTGRLSIGIGGHVERQDAPSLAPTACDLSPSQLLSSVLRLAAVREIMEELELDSPAAISGLTLLGYINDDGNAVGRVHFGILYVARLDVPTPAVRSSAGCCHAKWQPLDTLRSDDDFESWSTFVIPLLQHRRFSLGQPVSGYSAMPVCSVCECYSESLAVMEIVGTAFWHGPADGLLASSPKTGENPARVCLLCQHTFRQRASAMTIHVSTEPLEKP